VDFKIKVRKVILQDNSLTDQKAKIISSETKNQEKFWKNVKIRFNQVIHKKKF
jgi:hypothetical protein